MKHTSNQRRGRSRGNGRRQPSGKNRNYESSGPESKVRGSAQQVLDKYLALARDAMSGGDRIAAEGYLQHAEHYYRIINQDAPGDGKKTPTESQGRQGGQVRQPHKAKADESAAREAGTEKSAAKPETAKPAAKSEAAKPETVKAAAKSEAAKPETAKPETAKAAQKEDAKSQPQPEPEAKTA